MLKFSLPPRLKKILNRTLTGVSLLSLAAITAFTLALKVPIFNSWQAFAIQTGSMEPVIPTGALIFTRTPNSPKSINVGDIITFEQPGYQGKLITHRVHAINESGNYITKGDANAKPDDWIIPFGRIRGIGNWNIPYVGKAISILQSPLGVALFVLLPVAIIIWQEGRNIINILVEHKLERFFKHLRRAGYQVIPPGGHTNPPPKHSPHPAPTQTIAPHHSHRKTITQLTRKITITTTAAILLTLTAAPALARFISNSVTVANNTITTAAVFPSDSPTPSPSPSDSPDPSATPNPSQSPSPIPNPSGQVLGNCDTTVDLTTNLSNSNTGQSSTNTNEVEINTNCHQTETNQAEITNTIDIEANTGNNHQNQNTQEGNLQTGDVTIDLNINTTANSKPTPEAN